MIKNYLIKYIILVCLIANISLLSFTQIKQYPKNEKLLYLIHYGWINGGYAEMNIVDTLINDTSILYAKGSAWTVGLTDAIYNVTDVYESYFYPATGLPYKAIRNVNEGKYKRYNEVKFFQSGGYIESLKSGTKQIPDSIGRQLYDLISAFYHLRLQKRNFNDNEIITIYTYFDDKFWPLQIRYKGKKILKSKLGKIRCLVFSPVVETGRVFDGDDDLHIYISDDENFVPIRVQMDMVIGSFKADLIEYMGLPHEIVFN